MARQMLSTWLLAIVWWVGTAAAHGQAPVDPLRRWDEKPGSYGYGFAVDYAVRGSGGMGISGSGEPYRFAARNQEIAFSLSLAHVLREGVQWTLHLEPAVTARHEARAFPTGGTLTLRETGGEARAAFGVSWRLAPAHLLDPRYEVLVSYPWAATARASASLVRDPVVLLAALAYARRFSPAHASVALEMGVGFVANEAITFGASARYAVPLEMAGLPHVSLTLRTGYSPDGEGRREAALRLTFHLREDAAWTGLGLEWRAMGP